MAQVDGNRSNIAPANGNRSSSYAAKHKLADHFIGGNKLANAAPGPVKDFVAQHDAHTVITSVSFEISGHFMLADIHT
jgi:acetyl-CoA carboxylase/biotin carboxylase 1